MKLKINIETTLNKLLEQEDTDRDAKITIDDEGPKSFALQDRNSSFEIKGTYRLSILLQELAWAQKQGLKECEIDSMLFEEKPTERISRMIREKYWDGLTRTMDEYGIEALTKDTKNRSLSSDHLRVYVPFHDKKAQQYYLELEKTHRIKVMILPEKITPEYALALNDKPGILALKLQEVNGKTRGLPFVAPGGRFNEMYGWDSYFQNIGLLLDGKIELAKSVTENFQYEIGRYGKILNANRSYYLTRTQPPFYTSMIRELYAHLPKNKDNKEWLADHLKTAIFEYKTVWCPANPSKREISRKIDLKEITRPLPQEGKGGYLNRYRAEGIGIPPEVEEGHYDTVLKPFANKYQLSLESFQDIYKNRKIEIPELDEYFTHDRSARESGHDTTYRFEGICADILPVELNCMLYKYETDIGELIEMEFDDSFIGHTSEDWKEKAKTRKQLMNDLMWDESCGMFWDYNWKKHKPHPYFSVTCFFPLWVGIPTENQAEKMVKNLKRIFERGGFASTDEASRGKITSERPERQWDYPNGWAPHQIILWKGLKRYGYEEITQEAIYRWLKMITQNAVNYNGAIPEKYNVVEATHKVFAEYGNVGTEFEYITTEGFGWMNASYQFGLSLLSESNIEKINIGLI